MSYGRSEMAEDGFSTSNVFYDCEVDLKPIGHCYPRGRGRSINGQTYILEAGMHSSPVHKSKIHNDVDERI